MYSEKFPKLKISPLKYLHWFLFVVICSLIPILLNLLIDYWTDKASGNFFKGVRLIDFLICAFCLIGGALNDRYNSANHPSGVAVWIGIFIGGGALFMYLIVKYQFFEKMAAPGRYPPDSAWVVAIVLGYFLSIIYSLVLMRKTLTK